MIDLGEFGHYYPIQFVGILFIIFGLWLYYQSSGPDRWGAA